MEQSRDASANERFVPAGKRASLVFVIAGLAILFSSTWASRNPAASISANELFIVRFSMMATFLAVALAFRGRAFPYKTLVALAAVSLVVHVLTGFLVGFFEVASSEYVVLVGISSVFEGFGIALLEVMLLMVAAQFQPRVSAVAITGAYLLADILYCALLFMPSFIVSVSVPLGELVALIAAWVLLSKEPNQNVLETNVSEDDAGTEKREEEKSAIRDNPLVLGGVNGIFALTFTLLLAFVWGVVAELSGGGTVAFFDTTSEFIVIGVRLLLVVFCMFMGTSFGFGTVASACLLVWITGILIFMLSGDTFGAAVGGVVVKSGLYVLQALMLVLAARYIYKNQRQGVFVMGLVSFVLLGGQLSRFGYYIMDLVPSVPLTAYALMAWSCWLLVIASLVALRGYIVRRHEQFDMSACEKENADLMAVDRQEGALMVPDSSVIYLVGDTPLRRRDIDFCLKFEQFCEAKSLTEREREVLFEALHGRTVEGVAEELFLSRDTVKTYLSRAYARAGVNNKQAILKLIDEWDLKAAS